MIYAITLRGDADIALCNEPLQVVKSDADASPFAAGHSVPQSQLAGRNASFPVQPAEDPPAQSRNPLLQLATQVRCQSISELHLNHSLKMCYFSSLAKYVAPYSFLGLICNAAV